MDGRLGRPRGVLSNPDRTKTARATYHQPTYLGGTISERHMSIQALAPAASLAVLSWLLSWSAASAMLRGGGQFVKVLDLIDVPTYFFNIFWDAVPNILVCTVMPCSHNPYQCLPPQRRNWQELPGRRPRSCCHPLVTSHGRWGPSSRLPMGCEKKKE